MKRALLVLMAVLLVVALPIYGAGRLFVPNAILKVFKENLPNEALFKVGSVETSTNLNIIYKDIYLSLGGLEISFDEVRVSPRFSFTAPINLTFPSIEIKNTVNVVSLKNLNINVLPTGKSIENFTYGGEIKSLSLEELFVINDINFLLSEFNEAKPKLTLDADSIDIKYVSPVGEIGLKLKETHIYIDTSKPLIASLEGKKIQLDLSEIGYFNDGRKLFGDYMKIDWRAERDGIWKMPFDFYAENVNSVKTKFSEKLHVRAVGSWDNRSANCTFSELFRKPKQCGKMIDVVDVNIELEDEVGKLWLSGNGYCVAPKSGCPQKINAKVKSKNTAEIFSNVMLSGLINPLVGGVLLGGLLSSPSEEHPTYDHEVKVDIIGSQIFMNDQSLIN
jgi:hypothetical protein